MLTAGAAAVDVDAAVVVESLVELVSVCPGVVEDQPPCYVVTAAAGAAAAAAAGCELSTTRYFPCSLCSDHGPSRL